ncbi:hypothetical protein ACNJYA_09725 [Bradyrhizobium sp. DASA03068]|uniref:hypothetical protein n=1 Tax=Bradyrhizobium sp. BLXBL-01 TaxID=3395915 RepID=UPI003F6E54AD
MSSEEPWELDTSRPKRGQGSWVKRGAGHIAYAKHDRIPQEWLGSKLGELVNAPVALVEFGLALGQRAAISRLRSSESRSLSSDDLSDAKVLAALRAASGLIPYLVWIGSGDHGGEENYSVTPGDGGRLEIEAIDLGNCFEFREGGMYGVAILRELKTNVDKNLVANSLREILSANDDLIRKYCKQSGIGNPDTVADMLIKRKSQLQGWLESENLI